MLGISNHITQTKLEQVQSKVCDAAEACQRNREHWRLTLVRIKYNQKHADWALPKKKLMAPIMRRGRLACMISERVVTLQFLTLVR